MVASLLRVDTNNFFYREQCFFFNLKSFHSLKYLHIFNGKKNTNISLKCMYHSYPFYFKPFSRFNFFFFHQNKRIAKSLTVHVRMQHEPGSSSSSSRACLLARYDAEKICSDAYNLIKQFNTAYSQSSQW